MTELKAIVEEQLSTIDEEYSELAKLANNYTILQQEQVKKIKETSKTLLPLTSYIKNNGIRFTDNESGTYNYLGPILHYDSKTHYQYVLLVDQETPAVFDLKSHQIMPISYEQLLQNFDFISVIKNLLRTLTYHEELKIMYKNGIEKLEYELKEIEGIEKNN